MTEQISQPAPQVTDENRPFWEAAKRHELMLLKCVDCGHLRNPLSIYANICPACGSRKPAEWTKASGRGKVLSWVVVYKEHNPAFKYPYAVVIAELEEGPRFIANMRGIPLDQITADMPVEVIFEELNDEVTLPQFRPAK